MAVGSRGPGRYSAAVLPRKSSPRGMKARLDLRKKYKPQDQAGYHFVIPGSMNPRKS